MGQLSGVGFKRALESSPCANARPLNTAGKTKATARAEKFRPNFILAPPHQRSVPQRHFKLIHRGKVASAAFADTPKRCACLRRRIFLAARRELRADWSPRISPDWQATSDTIPTRRPAKS